MLSSIRNILILICLFFCIGFSQIPRSVYTVNSLGQNLSKINIENGNVVPDALPLGLFANYIRINNEKAYVVNSGANNIQIIDLAGPTTITTIDLGAGSNPWAFDFINDSLIAVSLLFVNQVAIVNLISKQVSQNITVGTGPEGVKYHDGKIYVTNTGFNGSGYDPGIVSVIDANTYTVINTLNVGTNPQDLDIDSQGQLIVACSGDYVAIKSQVDFVDLSSGSIVKTLTFPLTVQATSLRINPQDQCYIGTFGLGVMVYDILNGSFDRDNSNPLQGGPGIAFDNQGNAFIADFASDSVFVFSSNHQQLAAYQVGDGPVSIDIYDSAATSISEKGKLVAENFALFQNYPNPFNPTTNIEFKIQTPEFVTIKIYDVHGREINSLINNVLNPGIYRVIWDGKNSSGDIVSSGIYFYQLIAGNNIDTKVMHFIR